MKMKKTWDFPLVCVQQFEANEYVAACWTIRCYVGDSNNGQDEVPSNVGRQYPYGDNTHSATSGCGSASNQSISENPDGSFSIKEENWNGNGVLTSSVIGTVTMDTVLNGGVISWNTSATDGRVWHHHGIAGGVDPAHPNRS